MDLATEGEQLGFQFPQPFCGMKNGEWRQYDFAAWTADGDGSFALGNVNSNGGNFFFLIGSPPKKIDRLTALDLLPI